MTYLDNGRIQGRGQSRRRRQDHIPGPANGPRSGNEPRLPVRAVVLPERTGKSPFWAANGDNATVLTSSNDGRTIYTKAMPADDVRLAAVRVHDRAMGHDRRDDRCMSATVSANYLSDAARSLQRPVRSSPHFTRCGTAYRLITYDGAAPYTNGPLRERTQADGGRALPQPGPRSGRPSTGLRLSDDDDFGVGLFEPERTLYAGVAGVPGLGRSGGQRLPRPRQRRRSRCQRHVRLPVHAGRGTVERDSRIRVRPEARQPARLPVPN